MLKKILLVISLLAVSTGYAYASCTYNGEVYPEGTVIGPYVCTDGEWV